LKDAAGNNLTVVTAFHFYLSDNSDGSTITATTPNSISTVSGAPIVLARTLDGTERKSGLVVSTATGSAQISVTYDGGAKTYYMGVILPSGKVVMSSAIVFAA
jgi:hypothetical protein